MLASLPLEPIVLGEIARSEGIDLRRDVAVDTLFLGGSPLPPALQARMARSGMLAWSSCTARPRRCCSGRPVAPGVFISRATLVLGEVLDGATLDRPSRRERSAVWW